MSTVASGCVVAGHKPIFVISDLHLGDHSCRDSFAMTPLKTPTGDTVNRLRQFRRFLEFVAENNGELLILGDMFEFWKASIGTVLSKNVALLDVLAQFPDLTVILGNHDNDLSDFLANDALRLREAHPFFQKIHIPPALSQGVDYSIMKRSIGLENGGTLTIGFMHGHEVDVYNRNPQPAAGRAVTIIAGLVQDVVGGPVLPGSGKVVEEDLMDKLESLPKVGLWELLKTSGKGLGRLLLLPLLCGLGILLSVISLCQNGFTPVQIGLVGSVVLIPVLLIWLVKRLASDTCGGISAIFGELEEYVTCWAESLKKTGASSSKDDMASTREQLKKLDEIRVANSCDLLIMGHTHRDDITETICNSGNWVNFKPSFLKIIPGGAVELYRWQSLSEDAGEPVLRKKRNPDGSITVMEEFENCRPDEADVDEKTTS